MGQSHQFGTREWIEHSPTSELCRHTRLVWDRVRGAELGLAGAGATADGDGGGRGGVELTGTADTTRGTGDTGTGAPPPAGDTTASPAEKTHSSSGCTTVSRPSKTATRVLSLVKG